MNEWWFDPQHGYRRARSISWEDPNAPWQISDEWRERHKNARSNVVRPDVDAPACGGETRVAAWAELRPGEWYPAVIENRRLILGPDGVPIADPNALPRYFVIIAEPP